MKKEQNAVGEKAVFYFEQGSNCAEAVFKALSESMKFDQKAVPGIATGFGGGLGRNGYVCGAVSAGTMIIGLRGEGKGKRRVYPVVDRFLEGFEARFNHINCRELTGVDLKTEKGAAFLKEEGHKKCSQFVRYAAEAAHELLEREDVFN